MLTNYSKCLSLNKHEFHKNNHIEIALHRFYMPSHIAKRLKAGILKQVNNRTLKDDVERAEGYHFLCGCFSQVETCPVSLLYIYLMVLLETVVCRTAVLDSVVFGPVKFGIVVLDLVERYMRH